MGYMFGIITRRRPKHGAAASPQRRTDTSRARAACSFLLPWFFAATSYFRTFFRIRRSAALIGGVGGKNHIEQTLIHRLGKDGRIKLHIFSGFFNGFGKNRQLYRFLLAGFLVFFECHDFFSPSAGASCVSAFFSAAFSTTFQGEVLFFFKASRTITRQSSEPGTAPRTAIKWFSASTLITFRFCTVFLSAPICPAAPIPLPSFEENEDAPIEPGTRPNIEPWDLGPPTK